MKVNVKHLGKRRNSIEEVDMVLEKTPSTIAELIEETVKICVNQYNERHENMEVLKALSKQEIEDMAAGGRVTFGVHYGEGAPILKEAIENAKQSFLDGIVVIFIDGIEKHNLEDPIDIRDNTNVTFVRMTMLSGRLW